MRRQPHAWPQVACHEATGFGWGELGQLLEAEPQPDVLVVARSHLLTTPQPRSMASLKALMASGIGVCVRRAEQHHSAVASAAAGLARSLEASVHVQVFVTPARTHGFGWHYDAEDVFIVQTAGRKDYYFRENTVTQGERMRFDFSAISRERSQLLTARLAPGDCLYLPAGYWHMARSVEDALSLSLGVPPSQRTET